MSIEQSITASLQADYLTHGFISARHHAPDESGEVESVESILVFVPFVEHVIAHALACEYEFPGVFEYEVTQELGAWLHGRMPVSFTAFSNKLLELSCNFFRTDCAELQLQLSRLAQEKEQRTLKQAFGDHVFSLVNANDNTEANAQLGILRDDFVITDPKMSTCGRFFVDSMHDYQITHQQRDLLASMNSLLVSMAKNRVSVLADTAINDAFGLQQKVLAHPELQAQLSNVIGALMLDIIKSEMA